MSTKLAAVLDRHLKHRPAAGNRWMPPKPTLAQTPEELLRRARQVYKELASKK